MPPIDELEWQTRFERINSKLTSLPQPWNVIRYHEGLKLSALQHHAVEDYRTPAGAEIDFIIETRKPQQGAKARVVAVEAKLSEKWDRSFGKALIDLGAQKGLQVERMIVVYMGERTYKFDQVEVMPLQEFVQHLQNGSIF